MTKRILLVEDEPHIQEAIKLNLELEDYEVVAVDNGKDAIKHFKGESFDLIILDIMLPEMSGIEICEQIRLSNLSVPIMFLTAKDDPSDRVKGLKTGADDYLTKPFNLEEMLLRISGLIKRSAQGEEKIQYQTYTFGENEVNFITFKVTNFKKETFTLTNKEIKLLKLLVEKKNEVVSREKILQSVWGYDVFPTTRTIDNFILSFRKYFETDPKKPVYFQSVRGVGYKFTN